MFTKGALYALKEGMKSEGWGGRKEVLGEDVGMDETVVDWGRNKHIALEPGLNVA